MPKWFYFGGAFLVAVAAGFMAVYMKGLNHTDMLGTKAGTTLDERFTTLDEKLEDVVVLYNKVEKIKLWSFHSASEAVVNKAGQAEKNKTSSSRASAAHFLGVSTVRKLHFAIFSLDNSIERVTVGESLSNGWKLSHIGEHQVSVIMTDGETVDFQLFKGL